MILLDLPIPPSMNDYWRPGPNRSRAAAEGARVMYPTGKAKRYRKEVAAEWIAQRNRTPLCGPLEAGCFENDIQVASVSFRRMDETMKPGALIVHVGHDAGCRTSYRDLWAALSGGSRFPRPPGINW